MKRKMSIIVVAVVVLMMLTGCGAKNGPEKVVSEFVDGMKKFDFEVMASKVRPENADGTVDMEDSLENTMMQYIKSNAKKINYEFKNTEIDGDKAVVGVDFKYVNGQPVFAATLSEYMEQAFSSMESGSQQNEDEVVEAIITKQSKAIKESFIQTRVEFETVNIDGKWYVDHVGKDVLNIMMSNIK